MEDACLAGGASLFVSGIDPGFINDAVPLLASGLRRRSREIRAFETSTTSSAQPERSATWSGSAAARRRAADGGAGRADDGVGRTDSASSRAGSLTLDEIRETWSADRSHATSRTA
jgi:hypothetical protein